MSAPESQKREYDRELIKKRLQEGYGILALARELKTAERTLERFLRQNDLENYIPDRQTRLRKAKGKKDLRQYHDYFKKFVSVLEVTDMALQALSMHVSISDLSNAEL